MSQTASQFQLARDSLQAHYEALEAEANKMKRAKEVLIEEKRKLTEQATQLQQDLDTSKRQLREQAVSQVLETLSLPELDARWLGERETVRDFLQATIHTLTLLTMTSKMIPEYMKDLLI